MQIIKSNNIISVVAMSNEDPSYPKENAISKQPMKIAKSTSTTSTLILTCGLMTNVAFFNVDATSGKLEIVDINSAVLKSGTDISFTSSHTIASSTTDFSVFSDGDKIIIYGSSGNSGILTVSGTPTSTNITTVESVTTESAGSTITIVRFNDVDKVVNEDISFAYCKTWTDYFSGNSINIDNFYKQSSDEFSSVLIVVTITGEYPSIGLVFAGMARSYGVSQYGTSKNIEDNSLYEKSANGALNQVLRPVNINASVSVSCTRAQAVALENLWKYDNASYKVFNIKQDNTDGLQGQLLIYGKIEKAPRATWNLPDRFGFTLDISSVGGYES